MKKDFFYSIIQVNSKIELRIFINFIKLLPWNVVYLWQKKPLQKVGNWKPPTLFTGGASVLWRTLASKAKVEVITPTTILAWITCAFVYPFKCKQYYLLKDFISLNLGKSLRQNMLLLDEKSQTPQKKIVVFFSTLIGKKFKRILYSFKPFLSIVKYFLAVYRYG